jgi:hypothetical protein
MRLFFIGLRLEEVKYGIKGYFQKVIEERGSIQHSNRNRKQVSNTIALSCFLFLLPVFAVVGAFLQTTYFYEATLNIPFFL